MAEHGVIRWLAHQLSQMDTTPIGSLECCGALLMNLAMAQPGRQECHQVCIHTCVGVLSPFDVVTAVTEIEDTQGRKQDRDKNYDEQFHCWLCLSFDKSASS